MNKNNDSTEIVKKSSFSIGTGLKAVNQKIINGNLDNVRFGGTNIALEDNRILVIKGEDSPEHWTGSAVLNDVKRVVSISLGSKSL